jgi:hypothetical protein
MRPTPVPAPSVAQPPQHPNETQKVRKPSAESSHAPRNEPGRRQEPETHAYDDFSWM